MRTNHRSTALSTLTATAAFAIVGCSAAPPSPHAAQALVRTSAPTRSVGGSRVPPRPVVGSRELCAHVPEVRSVTVTRVEEPYNHFRFAFPPRVTVTSPSGAQAVARALCGLPPLTIVNCPIDLGIGYVLTFSPVRLRLAPVRIEAMGVGPSPAWARPPARQRHDCGACLARLCTWRAGQQPTSRC